MKESEKEKQEREREGENVRVLYVTLVSLKRATYVIKTKEDKYTNASE